jgi:hypothetical protein
MTNARPSAALPRVKCDSIRVFHNQTLSPFRRSSSKALCLKQSLRLHHALGRPPMFRADHDFPPRADALRPPFSLTPCFSKGKFRHKNHFPTLSRAARRAQASIFCCISAKNELYWKSENAKGSITNKPPSLAGPYVGPLGAMVFPAVASRCVSLRFSRLVFRGHFIRHFAPRPLI